MSNPTKGGRRAPVDLSKLHDRLPPHSLEAEMALLGSMILDHRVIGEVLEIVPSAAAFYREAHAAIFDALVKLSDREQSGDLVQLLESLKMAGILEDVGGADYLVRLAECVPSAVSAPHYAKIVRDRAQLRQLADAAGDILHSAMHAGELGIDGDATQVLDRAQGLIFAIAEKSIAKETETLPGLLQQTLDNLLASEGRTITGLDTGFYELSEMTSGLQPGELIIVAGRPSMGKTALALNLAEQIALGGQPHAANGPATAVGIFSMEMSSQALAQRLLCAHSGIDSHRLRTNRLSREDFTDLRSSCGTLAAAPIHIDDSPGLSILSLRAKARRMVAQHGVRCLIIDYLQLMNGPDKSRDGRQQEVSLAMISRGIKALARELEVPIVCLSQLNRGPEDRLGNRPRMSDLRESGSIEQDADVVMLLHREEYYHHAEPEWAGENPDKVGIAEVIVAKQRNGPTGTVELVWDAKVTRFRNPASRTKWQEFADTPGHRPPPAPAGFPMRNGAAVHAAGGRDGAEDLPRF